MTRRPRSASRRSPDAVIEPSGKASAAATPSRSGVSGVTLSGGGIEAMAQQHMSMHHSNDDLRSLLLGLSIEQQVVVTTEVEPAAKTFSNLAAACASWVERHQECKRCRYAETVL